MKTAEAKHTSSAHSSYTNTPFFQKNAESAFFSDSQTGLQTKPFFSKQKTSPFIQTKLTIGRPGDEYEQEADAMADRVVQRLSNSETIQTKSATSLANGITSLVQPKCAACEEEDKLQKKEEDEDRLENRIQRKPVFESDEPPPEEEIQRKCDECEKVEKLHKKGETYSSGNANLSSLESRLSSTRGSGSPLPDTTRGQMESSFCTDFSNVRIHTGSSAVQTNQELGAQAFTHGHDIYFNSGTYDVNSNQGKHLLAHELAHTIQQKSNKGIIQLKPTCESTIDEAITTSSSYTKYELVGLGEIIPWSAALHPQPRKYRKEEHDLTCHDLTKGTKVVILGESSKWIFVFTMGKAGFVSQELIKNELVPELNKPSFEDVLERIEKESASLSPTRTPIEILRHKVLKEVVESHPDYDLKVNLGDLKVTFSKIKDAFLILKKAENQPSDLTNVEQRLKKFATEQLKSTGKYIIDPATSKVEFDTSSGNKIKINNIEDFILFVEKVEATYPGSDPKEIVSEIRQIWFSDPNWEVLVASKGISENGKFVDIETEPDPIAKMFDMADLAPSGGKEKMISTPLGRVTISHVIAGIDAHFSGAPTKSEAKQHLKEKGRDIDEGMLKHKTLTKQHGGDPADFATWSGDFGQAYAEYLVDKYVKNNNSSTLKSFMEKKATEEQLLADIQGYIAVKVWAAIPAGGTPSGSKKTLSNILRDLYLVDKEDVGSKEHPTQIPRSYKYYFEQATGKNSSQLKQFIIERSLKFGSPWFAKKAVEHRGYWDSEGWTKEGILENSMKEFNNKHKENEQNASEENKIGKYIDQFLDKLNSEML